MCVFSGLRQIGPVQLLPFNRRETPFGLAATHSAFILVCRLLTTEGPGSWKSSRKLLRLGPLRLGKLLRLGQLRLGKLLRLGQ